MARKALLLAIIALWLIPPLCFSSLKPIFLSCGSSSSIIFSGDNPPRSFISDDKFILSSNSKTASFSAPYLSSLHSTARLFFASPSSYSIRIDANAFYILRLHFFPFPFPSTSNARFNVSAINRYLLLSSFSPSPSSSGIKEFLLWLDAPALLLTFSPFPNSLAFINALELIPSPPNLINSSRPLYVAASPGGGGGGGGDFAPQAMETLYRLNVGGPLITPANDTLWRTWDVDDGFLFEKSLSTENTTNAPIEYSTENGLTRPIAPDMVYRTARTMNLDLLAGMANFKVNLTWSFAVPQGFQHLVRMHFCNCWFPNQQYFYFEVYLGGFAAWRDLNPGKMSDGRLMVPFYIDFVVDAPGSGPLNVSISSSSSSQPPNALLNGLEIWKLSNSKLSLAGNFGIFEESLSGKSNLLTILLPSIFGGAVLLFILLTSLMLLRLRFKREEDEESGEGTRGEARPNQGDLQISIAEIMRATNNFDEKLVIGGGGFGKVYRGVLRDGTKVAVKRGMPGSRQGYPEYQTEVVLLSRIRHRHLVSLIGYCEEQSEMILVYEYMERGALRSYLYGTDLPCLDWRQRLEICIGAARGLHYLHTGYAQGIIHRDVKSSNILLGEGFTAKVSDFGLSRLGPSFGETHVSTVVKGTFGYLDPEYFKIQKLTEKSDVYSFGVLLLEVLCARPAIGERVNLAELGLHWIRKGRIEEIVDRRLLGSIDWNSLRMFGETAGKCLAEYGSERPAIGDVLWNLEYALQLQVTRLRREPFEDSGIIEDGEPISAAQPPRLPSSSSLPTDAMDLKEEAESRVFSQLVTEEGR